MNKLCVLLITGLVGWVTPVKADLLRSFFHEVTVRLIPGSLHGTDSNENGIRDDVEKKINKRFKDFNKRSIYLNYARLYSRVFKLAPSRDNATNWWKRYERLNNCELSILTYGYNISILENSNVENWLIRQIYNNKKRWNKYNEWMDKTYHYDTEYNHDGLLGNVIQMKELCDFKIVSYDKYFNLSLQKFFKGYSIKSRNLEFKKFEKKYETKYRMRYEKYYQNESN